MTRKSSSRIPRTREMLLPLPAGIVRSMSLESHLSLSLMRCGHGTHDTMIGLLRVLYMTFFMLEKNCSGEDMGLFLEVEAALDESIRAAAGGRDWQLPEGSLPLIELVLRRNDELLGSVPKYRYLEAWDRFNHFVHSEQQSPLIGSRLGQVWTD